MQSPLLAAGALLAVWTSQPSQAPQTFRSGVSAIPIYATVRSSNGALVPDLTREDFEIRDNGIRRDVTVFSREIVPITVTMMLDMSGSQERGVLWMRDAGQAFVDALLPADRARIGTFGAEIAVSPRLTGDKTILHRILDEEIWPGGATPLWEAVDRAMTSLADQPGRRVILTLTDGVDTTRGVSSSALLPDASGRTSLADPAPEPPSHVSGRVFRDGFMLYAVARVPEADPHRPPPSPHGTLSYAMRSFSVDSGGGYRIFSTTADARTAMEQVAEELHHQYLLGFVPPVLDGKIHKLEVTARRRGMAVQARKNYLAAAP